MKKLPIALAITAITAGSIHAADVIYSSEDFEGGTPNYTTALAGDPAALTLVQLQDGTATNITAHTALTGTDYTPGSPSRSGIFANGTVPGVTGEPTGQHGFVSNSQNRNLTLTNAMTLITDGVQSLNISFDTMVYAIETDFVHTAAVFYSALGDFTDSVEIATYTGDFGTDPGTAITHHTIADDTWTPLSLSISSADVTFTDTAKIRFNKLAPNVISQMVFYDNITVTGVTTPAPASPFTATITPAVGPDTGYDLKWTSQTGATYSVLTSTDLAAPVETWTVEATELAPTPPQNSYNVPADGVRRFYVIKEIAP